jgi:hypothetical protein
MGEALNPNVTLRLTAADKANAINIGLQLEGEVFAFARTEPGKPHSQLQYVVVGNNLEAVKGYFAPVLGTSKPRADRISGALQEIGEDLNGAIIECTARQLLLAANSRSPTERVFRSCCTCSQGVSVVLIGSAPEGPRAYTMIDQFVKVQTDATPKVTGDPDTHPIRDMLIGRQAGEECEFIKRK